MNSNHHDVTPSGTCLLCGYPGEFKAWAVDGRAGVCLACHEARYALDRTNKDIQEIISLLQPLQYSPIPNVLVIREALQKLRML